MKILLAYSSKTKNTKKVAEAIYNEIKSLADVTLLDIKRQKSSTFFNLWCPTRTLSCR